MLKERQDLLNTLIPKNGKLLDIGCARGDVANYIKQEGALYYGVDYNKTMLEECHSKGLNVALADLSENDLPFENDFFDVVFCSHVLEHFDIKRQIYLFTEVARVLKKGGKILFYLPTGYHWTFLDDETHHRGHSHISLRALAENTGFHVHQCRYNLTRRFPDEWQGYFRIPPIPWYLTEIYIFAEKNKIQSFSKEYLQ